MVKHLFTGFVFGIFFSTIAYAIDMNLTVSDVSGGDIKIEIQGTDGKFASGKIMVKVDGLWYQFENSSYLTKTKSGK